MIKYDALTRVSVLLDRKRTMKVPYPGVEEKKKVTVQDTDRSPVVPHYQQMESESSVNS